MRMIVDVGSCCDIMQISFPDPSPLYRTLCTFRFQILLHFTEVLREELFAYSLPKRLSPSLSHYLSTLSLKSFLIEIETF